MRIDDERAGVATGPVGPSVAAPRGRRGRPAPTSKDVARVAGVSQSTVSYVMSGKRPISERTRRTVLEAIDQLTYEPNAGARALAGHRTNVVGLVVPFHNPETASGLMAFAEEIAVTARGRDYDVLMLTAAEGPAGLARVQRRAMCDAVIVMEITTDDPRAAMARELEMPVIFIGMPGDRAGLHCIDFDFETGAELLVDELADVGCPEIAVLGWSQDRVGLGINYVPRFRTHAQARAADRGIALRWIDAPHTRAGVEGFLDAVLGPDGGPHPGLLTVHSPHDLGAALQQRGLVPGRDLDLVSLCTDVEAEGQPVPPTAVSPQPRDVSRLAMSWLFDLLEGDVPAELRLVDARLTRRGSVRRAG
ncbi:LacI family transcriptional regulator [Occultella glacieicola]|uniref:LacI family transcriptional regulator n=1 Tax=Occultella glacieicola TaxID=2518684 RepID=A0ABY2E5Q2_9MICO|nr:LacI family DNA-binding transcriptional regulator [Occultella glacieicola]TDE94944.1 LacI family transcriptional regulator [Occultella glacieicola]